jgi:hypothetical protein
MADASGYEVYCNGVIVRPTPDDMFFVKYIVRINTSSNYLFICTSAGGNHKYRYDTAEEAQKNFNVIFNNF